MGLWLLSRWPRQDPGQAEGKQVLPGLQAILRGYVSGCLIGVLCRHSPAVSIYPSLLLLQHPL